MCRDRLRPGWRELPRAHGREPAHGGGAAGANRHRRGGLCRAGGRIGAEPQAPRRAACDEAGFTAALEASYRQVWRPLLRRLG